MVMETMLIHYGVRGTIKLLIAACWKKHEHYKPLESVFSIWAKILEKHLDLMYEEYQEKFNL